jgi:hypothetical protein
MLIDQIATGTRSLRDSHPGDDFSAAFISLYDSVEPTSASDDLQIEFAFDEVLITAEVYRRAFRQFLKTSLSTGKDQTQSRFVERDLDELSIPVNQSLQILQEHERPSEIIDETKLLDESKSRNLRWFLKRSQHLT